jgi:hypothetical protein
MNRLYFSLLAAASLAVPVAAIAQDQAPAPIERPHYRAAIGTNTPNAVPAHVLNPAQGVQVLTDGQVDTVSSTGGRVELRLTSGRANVSVSNPADGTMILIDLPGGQADLVKDGFYTLNASTNTLSVLHGEAVAFPLNAPPDAQGKTVKEMQGAVLGEHIHPDDLYDSQAQNDILQGPGDQQQQTYANRGNGNYADGGYGDDNGYGYGDAVGYPGYGYGYPYYAGYGYGYPWGWNSAWGGYPFYGVGFGYYGGGYYRGGYGYRGIPGHYGYNPGHSGFSSGGYHGGFSGGGSTHGGFSGGGMSHGSSGGGSHGGHH